MQPENGDSKTRRRMTMTAVFTRVLGCAVLATALWPAPVCGQAVVFEQDDDWSTPGLIGQIEKNRWRRFDELGAAMDGNGNASVLGVLTETLVPRASSIVGRSFDSGEHWYAEEIDNYSMTDELATGVLRGYGSQLAFATDGSFKYVAVSEYADWDNGVSALAYTRSWDGGANWSEWSLLFPFAYTSNPQLATDGAGNWILIWERFPANSPGGTRADVVVSRSGNFGGSWTEPEILTATWNNHGPGGISIAAVGENHFIVVSRCEDTVFCFRETHDGGVTWEEERRHDINRSWDTGPLGSYLKLKSDGANNLVLMFTVRGNDWWPTAESREEIIVTMRSPGLDFGWSEPAAVVEPDGLWCRKLFPNLETDARGLWAISWTEYNVSSGNHTIKISFSYDAGSTWTTPQVVADYTSDSSTICNNAIFGELITDGRGIWNVVFTCGTVNGYWQRYVSRKRVVARNPCGNGVIDPGEQCDYGDRNGQSPCCTAECTSPPNSSVDCSRPLYGAHGFASEGKNIQCAVELAARSTQLQAITYPDNDPSGSIEENAKRIIDKVRQLLRNVEDTKVNVIAHSKGGLDVRMARHMEPELFGRIAMLGTPNRGAVFAELGTALCPLANSIGFCSDRGWEDPALTDLLPIQMLWHNIEMRDEPSESVGIAAGACGLLDSWECAQQAVFDCNPIDSDGFCTFEFCSLPTVSRPGFSDDPRSDGVVCVNEAYGLTAEDEGDLYTQALAAAPHYAFLVRGQLNYKQTPLGIFDGYGHTDIRTKLAPIKAAIEFLYPNAQVPNDISACGGEREAATTPPAGAGAELPESAGVLVDALAFVTEANETTVEIEYQGETTHLTAFVTPSDQTLVTELLSAGSGVATSERLGIPGGYLIVVPPATPGPLSLKVTTEVGNAVRIAVFGAAPFGLSAAASAGDDETATVTVTAGGLEPGATLTGVVSNVLNRDTVAEDVPFTSTATQSGMAIATVQMTAPAGQAMAYSVRVTEPGLRIVTASVIGAPAGGEIGDLVSESLVDHGTDSVPDALRVEVAFSADSTGEYELVVDVFDAADERLTYVAGRVVLEGAGSTIHLDIPLERLRASAAGGPFHLRNGLLVNSDERRFVATKSDIGATTLTDVDTVPALLPVLGNATARVSRAGGLPSVSFSTMVVTPDAQQYEVQAAVVAPDQTRTMVSRLVGGAAGRYTVGIDVGVDEVALHGNGTYRLQTVQVVLPGTDKPLADGGGASVTVRSGAWAAYSTKATRASSCAPQSPVNPGVICGDETDCGGDGTERLCTPNRLPDDLWSILGDELDEQQRFYALERPRELWFSVDGTGTVLRSYDASLARSACESDAPTNAGRECRGEDDCGGTPGTTAHCKAQSAPAPVSIQLRDQFHPEGAAALALDTVALDYVMVPTSAGSSPVDTRGITSDSLRLCYRVRGTRGAPRFQKRARVAIQNTVTGTERYVDLKKPARLCVPAGPEGTIGLTGAQSLMCYKGRWSRGEAKETPASEIYLANELTTEITDTRKFSSLCVPAGISDARRTAARAR